jgi:hypothetical protein
MIITSADDRRDAESPKALAAKNDAEVPSDPPPSYTSEAQPPPPSPSLPRPSNFIGISRNNGHVKGVWVIDPALPIPSLLSPVAKGESRKNFSVVAQNGVIDVDVTVVQEAIIHSGPDSSKCVTMVLKAQNGTITAKVHDPPASFPLPRPSISITAHAGNGHIHLRIPRSFTGPLSITTPNGSAKFSREVNAAITTFSEITTRRCFMGDYSAWREGEPWTGDEIVVEAKNGSLKLQYVDEVTAESQGPKMGLSGFWSKLFGI